MVATSAVAEEGLDAVEELLLPFADLDRVDLVGPRSSARVLVWLAASRATLALNVAECRFGELNICPSSLNRDLR